MNNIILNDYKYNIVWLLLYSLWEQIDILLLSFYEIFDTKIDIVLINYIVLIN